MVKEDEESFSRRGEKQQVACCNDGRSGRSSPDRTDCDFTNGVELFNLHFK